MYYVGKNVSLLENERRVPEWEESGLWSEGNGKRDEERAEKMGWESESVIHLKCFHAQKVRSLCVSLPPSLSRPVVRPTDEVFQSTCIQMWKLLLHEEAGAAATCHLNGLGTVHVSTLLSHVTCTACFSSGDSAASLTSCKWMIVLARHWPLAWKAALGRRQLFMCYFCN